MKLRDVGFTIGFITWEGEEHPAIRDERSGTISIFDRTTGKSREQVLDVLSRKDHPITSDTVIRASTVYHTIEDSLRDEARKQSKGKS